MSRNTILVVDLLLLAILFGGCDRSAALSTEYLRALGLRDVACAGTSRGSATCSTATGRFRCVVLGADGCSSDHAIACERFYLEAPAP